MHNIQATENLIRIGGKQLVLDIISLYREHIPPKHIRLQELYEAKFDTAENLAETEQLAHSIKSSAGNLGLEDVLDSASALEKAAAVKTDDSVNLCCRAFEGLQKASRQAKITLEQLEKEMQA